MRKDEKIAVTNNIFNSKKYLLTLTMDKTAIF